MFIVKNNSTKQDNNSNKVGNDKNTNGNDTYQNDYDHFSEQKLIRRITKFSANS